MVLFVRPIKYDFLVNTHAKFTIDGMVGTKKR